MINLLPNIPLADKTTYRIGGSARWYCEPASADDVAAAITRAREESLPILMLGKGSNILVSDQGWPGLVINVSAAMNRIEWDAATVTAEAGALLDGMVREAVHRGLAGMEELSGIPGTTGGAVVMNAGAFSTSIADTLVQATYLDMSDYRIVVAGKDELGLGYRTSILQKKEAIVLSAQFRLHPGDAEKLGEVRRSILEKRKAKQPLDLPNCGSVFKRPPGSFAGHLIEQAGLKGFRFGNAEISAKHANFIVNLGGATAAEVRHLIVHAQRTVVEQSGILLEPEVIFAGAFEEPLMSKDEG
jgi:UDP-N-acetylmuramate dehydrogenase